MSKPSTLLSVTHDLLSDLYSVVYLPSTGGFATGHFKPGPGLIRVWTADGDHETTLEGHASSITSLAARECDGQIGLVSGSLDCTARVWQGTECMAVLRGHKSFVSAVAVHPTNSSIIATGSADNTVRLWDLGSPRRPATCVAVLNGHTGQINTVGFMSDGTILSGSADATVRVWSCDLSDDLSTYTCKFVLKQPNTVDCLTVLPNNTVIVGGMCYVRKLLRLKNEFKEQWTIATRYIVSSVSSRAFKTHGGPVVFFDDCDGRQIEQIRHADFMAAMDGSKVMVLCRTRLSVVRVHRVGWGCGTYEIFVVDLCMCIQPSRIQAIAVMNAAWGAHSGVMPPRHAGRFLDERLHALARPICLRRFCRARGPSSKDMQTEIVEPFARDIVRFL